MHASQLPIHPTLRHPLTGQPLQAVGILASGKIVWPMMGGDGSNDGAGAGGAGAAAGAGAAGAQGAGAGTSGSAGAGAGAQGGAAGSGSGEQVPEGYAVDGQGRNLGYPKDTPVADMKDGEQAAYWRNQAQKHEGRYRNLAGDRSFDDTKRALDEYERIQREQQTPAEQALAAAREEGAKAATATANTKAAKAIFDGHLRAAAIPDGDIADLVESLNVSRYIGDDGAIDTAGLASFAARFKPGTGSNGGQQRQRDFGGGRRQESAGVSGSQAKAQLERRGYVKKD